MLDASETVQSQYAASPTIRALVDGFNAGVDPRNDIKLFYDRIFNPATAQGVGLDIWARIVGVERNVYVEEVEKNFGFYINSPPVPQTYPIPSVIQALPGYGWSAGTAYNYVDFTRKVYVQNVASVDLGTLSWSSSTSGGGQQRWYTSGLTSRIAAASSNSSPANILCAKYTADSFSNLIAHVTDMVISENTSKNIQIYDSGKTSASAADFKASLDGVVMYFELATPVETDVAWALEDIVLPVEPNTSLAFLNATSTAVPSVISYEEGGETVTDSTTAYAKNVGDVESGVTIEQIGGASFVDDGEIKSAAVTGIGYVVEDGRWQDWTPWDQGVFWSPEKANTGLYRIDDNALRQFIFWKALANISTSDCYTLNRLLSKLFNSPVFIEEDGLMHIRVVTTAKLEDWQKAVLAQYGMFGKPAGVGYEFWTIEMPVLGMVTDANNYQPLGQASFFNGVIDKDFGGN